jgi:glutamate formiminotransferase / formiminotetrahydrofolate cyclodeaminase
MLVECVPNFSEGRRTAVIMAITEAIRNAAPIHLLNVSSDPDHNRTVVTFVGAPDAVVEAAYAGVAAAAQHIDMEQHSGVHPRVGATDVMPFVPLRNISLEACAALATTLAQRVAHTLEIPVFLYEAAARRPERRALPYVRRDQYERLKTTIRSDPDREPDFGPKQLGSAGAVIIGVRAPLVAFNAYLDTDDVSIAQAIARRVRTSGGGLPYVRALGLLVKDRAQVSMNLTDFRQTSLFSALEAVRREAQQHHTGVTHTELVGLVPQAALIDAALAYLGLPVSARDLVLEQRVGAAIGDYREIPFE